LPSSIRDDEIATARDILMRETDKSSARHVVRVVVRLIWGLVRDGITERQHRLAGRLAGIAFALTVVPGIQSILAYRSHELDGSLRIGRDAVESRHERDTGHHDRTNQ